MTNISFFSKDSEYRSESHRDNSAPIYSLPIVLKYEKTATYTEDQLFEAAAQHMANIMSSELVQSADTQWGKSWRAWESQQFRKVVRRARPNQFESLKVEPDAILTTFNVSGSEETIEFISTQPHPADEPDIRLKKFQVSGLQISPQLIKIEQPNIESPTMILSPAYNLGASTGKMVAQICHAVQLMIYNTSSATLNEWDHSGRSVLISPGLKDRPLWDVKVVDAGFTELPPNSVTVNAGWLGVTS